MDKDINKENEWAKALKDGKIKFDSTPETTKVVLQSYQMSSRQRRAVRRDDGGQ